MKVQRTSSTASSKCNKRISFDCPTSWIFINLSRPLPTSASTGNEIVLFFKTPFFLLFAVFFKAVMNHFSWRHIAIIYDTYDVLMRIQGTALKKSLVADAAYPRPYDITFDTRKNPNYAAMLNEAGRHARGEFCTL